MKSYLDIVRNVLENGKWKKPVRRNQDGSEVVLPHDTLALPNQIFSHDMSKGFPLLTTKRMPPKTILVELEGFIHGITSKKWYQERGCKIWNEWANPLIVNNHITNMKKDGDSDIDYDKEYRLEIQKDVDDLGPIYGYQWRHFGETHDYGQSFEELSSDSTGIPTGTDQLKEIVDRLHENPYDRRMVCSAWNPNQIGQMALPPCHYAWNITVIGDELNLAWVQRSVDTGLGLSFNIASYGTLLLLLAKEGGFKPGNLTGLLVDCHIYSNQIDKLKEQIQREPYSLPTLNILDRNGKFSIFDWTHEDIELINYKYHPKLELGEVVV